MVHIIGVAGGSGAGKSTLAYGLQERFPDLIEVVHFDDYTKKSEQVPMQFGMKNWDCPDAINFDSLLKDLGSLRDGKDVLIKTKSEKHNPDYEKNGRIPYLMKSKGVILVEGYMAFTKKEIRELYDFKIFLDLDFGKRIRRRTKFMDDDYAKKILFPMHKEYVEPTKKFADMVVNVGRCGSKGIQDLVMNKLMESNFL